MADMKTIGVYPLTNTAALLVHNIDYVKDRLLVSLNGNDPQWYEIKTENIDGYWESGFYFGGTFVMVADILRV